jgi:hypothetical protein
MGIVQRTKQVMGELIGNTRRVLSLWSNQIWSLRPTFDWTRVDYAFYDKLWRGQAEGLEKSGLLVKPMVSKVTAWVIGRMPQISIDEDDDLEREINEFLAGAHTRILHAVLEAGKLGDCFLVLNGDGTLTLMPPDVVFPIVDAADYSKRIGWRVVAVHQHPESFSTMRIVDEYTAERRVRILSRDGSEIAREEYPNPLGRVPVIHIAVQRGANDLFGHPYAEPLLPLMHDYGQILDAGLDGNYKQGRPVFAIEFGDVQSMNKFWDLYGRTNRQTLSDGTTEEESYLDVDLEGVVTLANAKGDFKSPASSSGDTVAYLEILYYLFMEHTEMPEFLMGTAIASSKASAETQMPPFVRFIEMIQTLSEDWLREMVQLAIAYLRVARMRRGAADVKFKIQWAKLTDDDNRLTLDTLKWAYSAGLLDEAEAVRLMPVEVANPQAMLARIKQNAAENPVQQGDNFDQAQQREMAYWTEAERASDY